MSFLDQGQILFVTGMHRSGTSALCAALAACGVSFGERLLDAMAGVNDEGFWEDAEAVALNEQLLALADSTWYAPAPAISDTDWHDARFLPLRERASGLLSGRFAHTAALQGVKDPRFCLTLPFWLDLCRELAIPVRVCVINRAPLEVARSLEKRDAFPMGYGLRLYAAYRQSAARCVPSDAVYVRYDELLQDVQSVVMRMNLTPVSPAPQLGAAVRGELRHQQVVDGEGMLFTADSGDVDLAALAQEIEAAYPTDRTLGELAQVLTARGQELAHIGQAHSAALATLDARDSDIEALAAEHRSALATIDERDTDIETLSAEHRAALATVDERDEQIREFDRRLSQLGEEHSHALQTLRERDAELAWIKQRLEAVSKIPGVGYLIRRMRKHAQG